MRQRRSQLRERRHKASVPTVALVGYTNAGKTTLFNVLTGRRGGRVERAVRHARSARPAGAAARSPRAARLRHGRVHRSPAARAGRRVPRDARGSGRGRSAAARHRRRRRRIAIGRWPPSARCSRRSAPIDVPVDRGLQQVRPARRPASARRLAAIASRRAVRVGADRTRAATTSSRRWRRGSALDTATITFEFDPHDAADRDHIAELYRVAPCPAPRRDRRQRDDRSGPAAPPRSIAFQRGTDSCA